MLFKGTFPEITKVTESCRTNTDELFRHFNWNKLNCQWAVSKAIVMYYTINNQTPDYLSYWFIPRHEVFCLTVLKMLNVSYQYHSRALFVVHEVLPVAELCYGIA